MIALFLGAGFSKFWGLPLASEVMNIESISQKTLPGKWHRKWQHALHEKIKRLWETTAEQHKGAVDDFARMLHGSDAIQEFVAFLAL